MDFFLLSHRIDEKIFREELLTNFPEYCVLGVLLCLLISYSVYCDVLWRFLAKTKIPKLYKITTLHSFWTGLIHLMVSSICFYQLGILSHTLATSKLSQPDFLIEILHAASINICQYSMDCNDNYAKSACPVKPNGWTLINSISLIIICAVHIHEILLAIRNKMNYMFYTRLLGLIFVVTAAKTSCPALYIQGSYLMSINSSSKEIARAFVAWKSYSLEGSDHRPSPIMKAAAFLVFLYHMLVWLSLMLYYMPFFIHKMPSMDKNDVNRMFLAYAYLSFLAYILLEAGASPLWRSISCLGWCRRSSGLTWRIFALADCHLLGHYVPLVKELSKILLVLDEGKSKRITMKQKQLAIFEEEIKRKTPSDPQTSRPTTSLLAIVKTEVALRSRMRARQRANEFARAKMQEEMRADDIATRSVTLEDLPRVLLTPADLKPQVLVSPADSNLPQVLLTPADSDLLADERESSLGRPGDVEEKSTTEKDEVTSIENAMDAALAEEGEESSTYDGEDRTDDIQD